MKLRTNRKVFPDTNHHCFGSDEVRDRGPAGTGAFRVSGLWWSRTFDCRRWRGEADGGVQLGIIGLVT